MTENFWKETNLRATRKHTTDVPKKDVKYTYLNQSIKWYDKKYKKSYNYNPSTKLHANKEVKKKTKIRLKVGDTLATVYKDLINDASLSLFSAFTLL
jgi:hypothetical protein